MPHFKFGQRPPRLAIVYQRYDCPVWFVSFNTANRLSWLACESVHNAFIGFALRAFREHSIAVGRYVLMPDHAHLFVSGRNLELGKWVGMLKQVLAKAHSVHRTKGANWQEGFFDHLLRSDQSYGQKWQYVRDNPVRAGLVSSWEEWPWQGEIVRIDRTCPPWLLIPGPIRV